LIDDKYQSGTTAQFVASHLYQAGAAEVCGLFCIKTWRDTDNM
jgi:predicted amidophosphoribosyltransferase